MTDINAPASYRGPQTAEVFLREVGKVWIGLLETAHTEPSRIEVLAGYFGVSPDLIGRWIDARGRIRCVATLPDGRRCAVLIGQRVEYDPNAWARHDRACARHGG